MSERLDDIAAAMVPGGKGILAADDNLAGIQKRFDPLGVASTPETRRDARQMLLGATDTMQRYISGVIFFDETFHQTAADGTPLVELVRSAGALPGIKVDIGPKPLAGFTGETITEGLDGLRERLAGYRDRGARFAKWRAVIAIDVPRGAPSETAIGSNMHALARYAALCQEARLVPVVEPDILMDGRHDIDTCYEVSKVVLLRLFGELHAARVKLEGTILKPNMVTPGRNSGTVGRPEEVAEKTLMLFRQTVPVAVPGIAFLSGGQADEEATANLNAMNAVGPHPWKLTFSFNRALQAAAQKVWLGRPENVPAAREAFAHRARMNALASLGQWRPELESAA